MSITKRQCAALVLVYVPLVAVRLVGVLGELLGRLCVWVSNLGYSAEVQVIYFARWVAGVKGGKIYPARGQLF